MLVLARQRDETIMIGDNIEVTVVDIRGDKVRLGVTAPKNVSVHRMEVYDEIRRENRAAAQINSKDLENIGGRIVSASDIPMPPHDPTVDPQSLSKEQLREMALFYNEHCCKEAVPYIRALSQVT